MEANIVQIPVDSLAAGGAGVGRSGGKVYFVNGAYPGDVAEIRVEKEEKRFAEGSVVRVVSPSTSRVEPPCPYAGDCGGCPWMGLEYAEQLKWKSVIVADQFKRIAKVDVPVSSTASSPLELGYRARLRLKISSSQGSVKIGYHRRRSNDIVDVERCIVANEAANAALFEARTFLKSDPEAAAKIDEIEIETGWEEQKARICLILRATPPEGFTDDFLNACPSVKGVYAKETGAGGAAGDNSLTMMTGGGMTLAISPGVFTQVNPLQNIKLVERVVELSSLGQGDAGLELYCGMGNIALPIAVKGAAMTGVEFSKAAVECGKNNAVRLLAMSASFVRGDAGKTADRMATEGLKFKAVLIDPPRNGAKEALGAAAKLAKEKIVYVSCDPATLARDAAALVQLGFKCVTVETFDMFPQTAHVETVALFERAGD